MIRDSVTASVVLRLIQIYNNSGLVKSVEWLVAFFQRVIQGSGIFSMLTFSYKREMRMYKRYTDKPLPKWIQNSFLTAMMKFLCVGENVPMVYGSLYNMLLKVLLFGMIGMMPAIPFYRLSYYPMFLSVPFFIAYLRRRRAVPVHIHLYAVFLLVIIGLSSVFSLMPSESIAIFAAYVLFYSIFLFVVTTFNQHEVSMATSIAVISTTAVSLLGVYQYFFADMHQLKSWVDTDLNPLISARAYGTFGDPNTFAIYLIPVLFFGIYHILKDGHWFRRLLFLGATGLNAIAFLLTLSRSSWVGLAVALLIALLLYKPKLLPIAIVLGMIGFLFLPDVFTYRIFSIFLSSNDSSMQYREAIWSATSMIIADFWKSGIGVNYEPFRLLATQYHMEGIFSLHTHNLYLQWIVETGIFGLLAFLIFMLSSLATTLKGVYDSNGGSKKLILIAATAILVSYLVTGIVEYNLLYMRNVFMVWMTIGMSLASAQEILTES